MKLKAEFDLDGDPTELRIFFGLPDFQALQNEIMSQILQKMHAGVDGFDPISLMKPFWPENMKAFQDMQKTFWNAMADVTPHSETGKPKGK